MACSGPRINRYLEAAARELARGPARMLERFAEGLVVVQGSPSADLDSVAASLSYALLLHEELLRRSGEPPGAPRRLVTARLTVPRESLRFRPEIPLLLRRAGVDGRALADPGTFDLGSFPPGRLSLVLVDTDGRELPPALRSRVSEIVDHHPDLEIPPESVRTHFAPVGSASTLVVEQILERLPSLLDRSLALLLLGAILLDTVNLDAGAGRATDRDHRAAEELRRAAGAGARGLYEQLRGARGLLDGLSGRELLRRDYKEGRAAGLRFGMASVPVSAREWAQRDREPETCLRELAEQRRLDLLAVLFAHAGEDGVFHRQLLLRVRGAERLRALLQFFAGLALGLQECLEPGVARWPGNGPAEWDPSGEWYGGLFEQGEPGFSRKRLDPALRSFLSTHGTEDHGR